MILFRPHGLRETLLAGLQRLLIRTLIKPVFSPRVSIRFQRRWLSALARTTVLPRSVRIRREALGGVDGEWVRDSRVPDAASASVLYLHGGAYCIGSPATHRALTARLSRELRLPVYVPHYRLAPEHPHPAALDDALAAYRVLRARGPVIVGGDSAGGGLSLALALALRDRGEPPPACLLLLSPWADLSIPDNPPPPPPGEVMLSLPWAESCATMYRAGRDPAEPYLSPLKADLRGLPPTLIQAGTDELLHGQALELDEALRAAGVSSRCEVTQRRWHVFQLHVGLLRGADEAVNRLASFAACQLPRQAADGATEHEVVILGAGMSGLCMGVQLQQAGVRDFVILEKQPGLGGTWWDNTYPGAHVDVPAPAYSFSFAPNPDWSRRFAGAPEIQAYMQSIAQRHALVDHMRFNTLLQSARFEPTQGLWHFQTADGQRLRARFFVCSTGPLNQPRWPDIEGLDEFTGTRLHSARWDHSVPLEGKRVAVIGTGSTASQLVAPIASRASALHVFQRTANWVMPRMDRPYHALDRWLARFGPYARFTRWGWVQVMEWGRRGFDEGTLARRGMLKTAAAHRRSQVKDPVLRDKLTPAYPLGCKRIIYSNDFYPALTQPHVELVTDAIRRITPRGVVTADGREREIDVLVCATGFDTQRPLASVNILGLNSRPLSQAWADGPNAYHGITVHGFPNLFLMLGPNTGTGHTSTLLYIEPEVQHAIGCMRAVRKSGLRWIEVREDVQAEHNRRLQSRLDGSVWSHCRSWYRNEAGKITALFPGFTPEYVRAVAQVDLADYTLR